VVLIYQCFISLYVWGIRVAARWNPKAAAWVNGRKNLLTKLKAARNPSDRLIWVHCASAGELEQGKPLISKLRETYPDHKVLISFFSPSGMAAGEKYKEADLLTYLPSDTAAHARAFVELVNPELVVFVKYEYWYHHLSYVAKKNIPLLLVSAIFRKEQPFFKWYGRFFRRLLFFFRQIFVQDQASKDLLAKFGVGHAVVGGDTRFDRVLRIIQQPADLPVVAAFSKDAQLLVAGSTWPDDEKLLQPLAQKQGIKLVIAPHEMDRDHLSHIEESFNGCIRYSEATTGNVSDKKVLIIDNFGMLSRLYRYGKISYIGGGFNKSGIHNTLEAAVWGKPVFFGPNYSKFREARDLVQSGAAQSCKDAEMLEVAVMDLLKNETRLEEAGRSAAMYVVNNAGATDKIVRYIQENRLLTS